MPVVMIANRKGGSGKTSLAWNLAVLSKGLLVDADPQGSLRLATDVPVVSAPGPQVLADLKKAESEYPLVWLDTSPTLDARVLSLMAQADYFLVPTAASALGLEAARYTLQEIGRKGRLADALVVFCLTSPRPDRTYLAEVAAALAAGGVAVARTRITRRAEVEAAPSFGASVVTHKPNGKAVDELQQLWGELKALWGLKHARLA